MNQHVAIEDVILPFRTYAWAVTGSVCLADQLLTKCFERISATPSDPLPSTRGQWFDRIDSVVVDWACTSDVSNAPDYLDMTKTVRMISNVEQDVLSRLLDLSKARL